MPCDANVNGIIKMIFELLAADDVCGRKGHDDDVAVNIWALCDKETRAHVSNRITELNR